MPKSFDGCLPRNRETCRRTSYWVRIAAYPVPGVLATAAAPLRHSSPTADYAPGAVRRRETARPGRPPAADPEITQNCLVSVSTFLRAIRPSPFDTHKNIQFDDSDAVSVNSMGRGSLLRDTGSATLNEFLLQVADSVQRDRCRAVRLYEVREGGDFPGAVLDPSEHTFRAVGTDGCTMDGLLLSVHRACGIE